MNNSKIWLSSPHMGGSEQNYVQEAFDTNWVAPLGPNVNGLEKDLESYYNVGKLLVEAQGGEERAKYGDGLIKEYSKRLTSELGKGYSIQNLKYMRKFYQFIQNMILI